MPLWHNLPDAFNFQLSRFSTEQQNEETFKVLKEMAKAIEEAKHGEQKPRGFQLPDDV